MIDVNDAPDGRVGGRGHRRRVEEAGRRLGRGRRDHRLDLDRQDRHRRRVAGQRPRGGDRRQRRRDGRRRHRDGADRHRRAARRGARLRERRSPRPARARPTAALEAPGEAGELQGDTTAQRPVRRARRPALLAGGHADRRRARRRPRAGRGHGPRRARAQEGRARVSSRAAPKEEPPMHIESPYRPDEPVAPKQRRSRACSAWKRCRTSARPGAAPAPVATGARPAALAHAPGDRLADGAVAADRGDLHDDRRGRHDPHRGRAQGGRSSATCPTRRGRRSRRCSSSRRSTPRSRTNMHTVHTTPCTSASPSRSARAA